jgi:dipeptidase D
LAITSSQRSAIPSRLHEISSTVHAVAALAGANVQDRDFYPPWPADMASILLEQSRRTYLDLYGSEPKIQVIHAGLECAVIGDIYPGMDMISFGPTIRNPHSPSERMHIPSIEMVWNFLTALIKAMRH